MHRTTECIRRLLTASIVLATVSTVLSWSVDYPFLRRGALTVTSTASPAVSGSIGGYAVQRFQAPERQWATLQCQDGERPVVVYAEYSRVNSRGWADNTGAGDNCWLDVTDEANSRYCRRDAMSSSCIMPASNVAYGDPCFGARKEVWGHFACVGSDNLASRSFGTHAALRMCEPGFRLDRNGKCRKAF